MLTALHITLPKKRVDRYNDEKQNYPNRCLVVNDETNEVRLISTEAALKYMTKNNSSDSQHERQAGAHFRFDHIAMSPHHGSIFVKQVAPMLYDLCHTFFRDTAQRTTQAIGASASFATYDAKIIKQAMNRTVYVYGSQSDTDRRSLFIHLAKAVAQAMLQQTVNSSCATSSDSHSCEVSFSLVDLYHKWGVGDVLDLQSVMHDSARLEKSQRKHPRWSLNEPKGIAFVEPTRQLLDKRDSAANAIIRSLQRTDAPRGLRTESEKGDHETKSTLVLTFYLSPNGTAASYAAGATSTECSRREFFDDCKYSHLRSCATVREAKLHLILLPDSDAAAHGKQVAQELCAIGGALGSCTKWFADEENKEKAADTMGKDTHRSLSPSKSVAHWAPLRESSLLLYVFESTLYYTRQKDRSQRQLIKQRNFNESREGSRSRSVSPNLSISSNASNGLSAPDYQWFASAVNAVECICSGMGHSLLIVCVNSGWDQYYHARSAFLFAQRATNQLVVPDDRVASQTVNDTSHNEHKNTNSSVSYMNSSAVDAHSKNTMNETSNCVSSHDKSSELAVDSQSSPRIFLNLTPKMSSPRWKDQTQPRLRSPQSLGTHEAEKQNDNSPEVFMRRMPSDVPVCHDDVDMDSSESNENVSGDRLHFSSSLPKREARAEMRPNIFHTSVRQLFSPRGEHESSINTLHEQQPHMTNYLPSTEMFTGRDAETFPKYTPHEDRNDGVIPLENIKDMPCPTTLPSSPGVNRTTDNVRNESSSKESLSAVPQTSAAAVREKDEKFRAMFALMSLREADAWSAEAARRVGVANVCNAELLGARCAARCAEMEPLRAELIAVKKWARLLEKSLARSVKENRKVRRSLGRKLQLSLAELPKVLRDVVQQSGGICAAVGEERMQRWEELLKTTVECMAQVVPPGEVSNSRRTEKNYEKRKKNREKEEEEEEEERQTGMDDDDDDDDDDDEVVEEDVLEEAVRLVGEKHLRKEINLSNHSVGNAMNDGGSIRTSGEENNSKENISRASQSEPFIGRSLSSLNTDPQILALLRKIYQMLLSREGVPSDEIHLEEEKTNRITADQFHRKNPLESITQKASSTSGERAARSERIFGEDHYCTNESSQNCVHCDHLVRLLSAFMNQVSTKGSIHDPYPHAELTETKKSTNIAAENILLHESGSPLNVRESFAVPQDSKEMRSSSVVSHRTVQRLESELQSEREKRHKMEEEMIRLRAQLDECKSKLAFIDRTVKPKISKDIVELQRADCERKARQAVERQRRDAVLSEIRKSLEDVEAMASLGLQPLPLQRR